MSTTKETRYERGARLRAGYLTYCSSAVGDVMSEGAWLSSPRTAMLAASPVVVAPVVVAPVATTTRAARKPARVDRVWGGGDLDSDDICRTPACTGTAV